MDMEKQKNKTKAMPARLNCALILKICLFFILSLIAVVALLIIYAPTGEIHQTSLPDDLRPTAEYLHETVQLEERISMPDIQIQMFYREGNELDFSASYEEYTYAICFGGSGKDYNNYLNNSRIFVNGQRVRGYVSFSFGWGDVGSWSGFEQCIGGNLEPGLHLIEFHLRDSFLGAPLAIQQWAIEVE